MNRILGSEADVARQILEAIGRLETLLALSVPPEQPPAEVFGKHMTPGDWQQLIVMSICAALQPAPATCQQVIITPTGEDLLIRNESADYVNVEITNEDLAQWIWVGPRGVLQTAGRIILPLDTARYVLGRGNEIYGRCAFATVNVSVIQGENLFANFLSGGR